MSIFKKTIDEINSMLNQDVEIVERRAITSLTIGEAYVIKKIILMSTRFGKAILVTLYDKTHNETFQSFLPKRITETLAEETIETLNKLDDKYTLIYLGQSSKVFSGGNSRAILNFGVSE